MGIVEIWSNLWSFMASIMFVYVMYGQFLPYNLLEYIEKYTRKLTNIVNPYVEINFFEKSGDSFEHDETYELIQTYLSANSSQNAKRLTAKIVKESKHHETPRVLLTLGDYEEIIENFKGIKVWWLANRTHPKTPNSYEQRFLTLTFHKNHRDLITTSYIQHVLEQGKAITMKNRQLKLYTNKPSDYMGKPKWSHTTFQHPACFETLAMEPCKKEEIINDLIMFSKGKEYYNRIGKAWKLGYLLFGPPGTGKSTMISAIANFMNYDVYDLELTSVLDNNELKKLLIDTSSKSIIVIEDIDCSLDLTSQRKNEEEDEEEEEVVKKKSYNNKSDVTLSSLLNFIDGIWSACGGERIIIFTTNFVDKLDPALIRRGRMDKHIEMSYCGYQAFKILAKNYLDVESHDELFPIIEKLLGETNMTPADVAENLIPKSINDDFQTCLNNLIQSLHTSKQKAEEKA
ncbi:LOW QUALITY PROTEIN: AAA-ATPase ASD, mitochondrial-like [Cicer arietinum]|uniref:LOW QUALITY PROTEIN: AAA-ATPase ASD, mitochondrial-like n=1 Tax=Cicer arietinum TaxID=3827 RepID=UPI003CC5BAF3